MNDIVLTESGSFDLRNLSEVELEVIVQVIQKDFEIKASEKARLRRRRRKLKEADERVSILANSNFNDSFCVICFKRFVLLFYPKKSCISCRHCMCRDCSVWIPRDKEYICLLCQSERTLKSMGCDWYYGLLKNRFQHDASELVAQSLYSNQGQCSFMLLDTMITPDLLQKVKGSQISRYRQKIQCKWEEMHERLRRVDLSSINRVKREELYRALNDEYKIQFKNILKEFSQVLYITLENYAAKTEDVHLDINEQVMETVHEEVELLIGYKINLIPEDMQSVISDVESTVSMFMGNQLEERLAMALINKVNEDHLKVNDCNNYDVDCLDNLRADDLSSTSTFLYQVPSNQTHMYNGAQGSCKSSIVTISRSEPPRNSVKVEYVQHTLDSSQCGTESDFNNEDEMKSEMGPDARSDAISEVALSAREVQHIMKYPNSDPLSLVERQVNVPLGEPINLLVELNGVNRIDVVWTISAMGRKVVLSNDRSTEIITSSAAHCSTSNLRIWQSKDHHAGLYTAHANNRPIAAFLVKITDIDLDPEKPSFRLKLFTCNVRSGQTAEFSVEAVGHPEPRLVFYHHNTILDIPSEKYTLEHVPNINRVILKINRVTASDKGVYRCVATNELGSCECNAELQVTSINFRFENKLPAYEGSANSSIDGDTGTTRVHDVPDFSDHTSNMFDSNTSVNQLVEIHQHLTYLEWQLDWFEEQASQGDKALPDSGVDIISDTVIGRELPDEVSNYAPDYAVIRPSSVQSDESGDMSPNTARAKALRSSSLLRSDSASHVSRLREMFNQQALSPPFQRKESISGRTPPSGKRKLESQLTREVRIRRDNSFSDNYQ